jgi:hypothetical protein
MNRWLTAAVALLPALAAACWVTAVSDLDSATADRRRRRARQRPRIPATAASAGAGWIK